MKEKVVFLIVLTLLTLMVNAQSEIPLGSVAGGHLPKVWEELGHVYDSLEKVYKKDSLAWVSGRAQLIHSLDEILLTNELKSNKEIEQVRFATDSLLKTGTIKSPVWGVKKIAGKYSENEVYKVLNDIARKNTIREGSSLSQEENLARTETKKEPKNTATVIQKDRDIVLYVISCIALILSGYSIGWQWYRSCKRKNHSDKKVQKQEESTIENELNSLKSEVIELQKTQLLQFQKLKEELTNLMETPKPEPQTVREDVSRAAKAEQHPKKVKSHIYVFAAHEDKLIPDERKEASSNEAYYQIELDEGRTSGAISLNEQNTAAIRRLTNNSLNSLQMVCDVENPRDYQLGMLKNVSPGTAELRGDSWHVSPKIKVRYVNY